VKQETLETLFVEQLRDLYDAEKQLVKALPKIAKAASSEELSQAVTEHLEETKGHVARLEEVFQLIGENAKSKPCKGMRGLIEEGGEVINEEDEEPVRDLALIAAAQKVEHYEISAYGTARTVAEQLNNRRAAQLLRQTEDEEKAADSKLSEIAEDLYAIDNETEGEEGDIVSTGRNGSSTRNGRSKSPARTSSGTSKSHR
jgi:ferritin-like metal-binding protein YciE